MENNGNLPLYIANVSLDNVEPFQGENNLSFMQGGSVIKPTKWTVILGNNNTGKTRLLKYLTVGLDVINQDDDFRKDMLDGWIENEYLKNYNSTIGTKKIDKSEKTLKKNVRNLTISKIEAIGSFVITTVNSESTFKKDKKGKIKIDYIDQIKKDLENKRALDIENIKSIIIENCKMISIHPKNSQPLVIAYGVNRKSSKSGLSSSEEFSDPTISLFSDKAELLNLEDWLLQIDYASKNKLKEAKGTLNKIKSVLKSGVLPDIKDFRLQSINSENGIKSYVEFLTDFGWRRLENIGYGYQSSMSWIMDLVKRMFDYYSSSSNPLRMPAVVLIDEIDLHIHPSWQRKIIGYLSRIFPNIQFVVTSHSPLIVQSIENINLIVLKKEEDHVCIYQPNISTYKGWTVEEILSEMMGLEEKTYSDTYLELISQFDQALDGNDIEKAKFVFSKLDEILHPASSQRKLLKIQMASLTPIER